MATRQPGIIITQPGVSVQFAADYQMVFNSNWPSLQVAFDYTTTLSPNQTITVKHNLKFPPFHITTVCDLSGNFITTDVRSDYVQAKVNTTDLVLKASVFLNTPQIVNVKLFNIDLTKQVDYTLPQPAILKTKYDPTYGIKVVKYGKSIGSTDLRDFILHSRAQSPATLSVITEKSAVPAPPGGGAKALQYNNPAGYVPWVFAFSGNPDFNTGVFYYTRAGFETQAVGGLSINLYPGAQLNFNFFNKGTLVVLRDPLFVPQDVQVTYNG